MTKEPLVLSWSGGKDSALTLHTILSQDKYEVRYLLTTVTKDYGRISMHGVREELLSEQVRRTSINSDIAYISKGANNEEYERVMMDRIKRYQGERIANVAFGDLFLEDIRKYREQRMSGTGIRCIFPLWGKDTTKLAHDFIKMGFKAILCTVDPKKLSKEFAGKEFDENFLSSLPQGVDPCGENGEFHTFVYEGPIYDSPIPIRRGETVLRDGFYFSDILLRR
ncbi:MAG: adenine nucleotide alpha hydrolase [Thermoplasmatales archaeon]|jgi:uncharacterized protein (TIGR00290 family)|nr:adenine nucleotide alpha hydrolase [Candidatus Thermoplasmatota archaeon]MCL6003379.1 adenine nucleotide alpha hydrolase [Candidatus Thermoplasmatota archaeon]MDA8055629.1 adenine nucleotide alpha hydrolase [Thermoplasmatales archaeon]